MMLKRPAYHLYSLLAEKSPAQLLPWNQGDPPVRGDPRKTVVWIEGLRGMASFLVILTHLARAWDYALFAPRDNPDVPPRLLQLPILRIPWQGRIGVTIFGFLTGYVCALKPLKLRRAGNIQGAFTSIAKSAFRRPPRLIFPATIAMCCSWLVAQFGGFTVANRSDSDWCRYASPELEDSLWKEIIRLFKNFLGVWTTGYMAYDDHQWALLPLLNASMVVYIVTFATMYCTFKWRALILLGLIGYYHQSNFVNVETFQLQALYGMLLSDLSNEQFYKDFIHNRRLRWPRRLFCLVATICGLFIASYPGERPDLAGWSQKMEWWAHRIFPKDSNIGRRYSALGLDLIILAIISSPTTMEILSNRLFLWLGKHSFSVYLTHGTMLRVPLVWMLYGISGQPWVWTTGPDGQPVQPPWLKRRPPWVFCIAIPTWLVMVYIVASLWTNYVDPFCARMTQKLEDKFFEKEERNMPSIPMTERPN